MLLLELLSILALVSIGAPLAYLYLLAIASIRVRRIKPHPVADGARLRFAITIPAHNEEGVIEQSVAALKKLDYPAHLFDVHVVADYCTDQTAEMARRAGAIVHERQEGLRGSKGAAMRWLFERLLSDEGCAAYGAVDGIVVFDADTVVSPGFIRLMDQRLREGAPVVQGQHRISNPDDGWFPALMAAMFIVDNRFQNLGRSNLGWSAKNMGDSICYRADVLKQVAWTEGLTEDYEFRQRLLLGGMRIVYEPGAIGYGEAAANWTVARAQRARWLAGTYQSSHRFAGQMLREGLRRLDLKLLDGAAQSFFPSYSTLTLISAAILVLNVALLSWISPVFAYIWTAVVILLGIYPLVGLGLERAPVKTFIAMSLGPLFIIWRTVLSLMARFGRPVEWVRTARRGTVHGDGTAK
ncbi:MAG: glycosyltransferase family 2 protein [Anaerolineae bacterium]